MQEPKLKENRWNHKLEKDILEKWNEESNIYKFDENADEIFIMDTPPPYPSGRPWHIGAAAHYSQIDMIARSQRMMGKSVMFPIGIDRNGIGVENYTEKKCGVSIHTTSRENFLKLCKETFNELEDEMITIMKHLGLSCDFKNYYRTDSDEYRALTQSTFINLWKNNLIYEDTRPNNFCVKCGTTIADAEVLYDEISTDLVYMKFKTEEDENIIVASTRPELLGACQIIIVNPKDKKNSKFIGKNVIIPLFNRKVKVISHPQAKIEFGSGVAMICSYGDFSDVRLFRELKLKEIVMIDKRGKLTDKACNYNGLSVKIAREKIIEDLEKSELIIKKEKIIHRTPICERSKNPIEIIPMKEYYLKQLNSIEKIREATNKLKMYPKNSKQILLDWINSISIDWPISRRRFYATEIPIWYCKKCNEPHIPKPGKYYRPWKDNSPFEKCNKCNSNELIGETRTFDTWMDSSISALAISKLRNNEKLFEKTYPTSIRTQGKDIIRTWLYYSMLRCEQITKKIPWDSAWIMGYVVDEKGKKMSKSKGNVVDPIPILDNYGSDNFRFWSAAEAGLGSDFRFSEDKLRGSSKFMTKLWNIARFVSSFPQPSKPNLTNTDKWILNSLEKLILVSKEAYKEYNFFIPANKIREFVWNIFADHYIEMIKTRAYGEGNFNKEEIESAHYTLHEVLRKILQLIAPITPFITDYVYRNLYESKVHNSKFENIINIEDVSDITNNIIEFNSNVWNEKKSKGISLRDEISFQIPENLKSYEKDLIIMHKLIK